VGAALTPPVLVAALVVVLAAAAKLRSPATAGEALAELGMPLRGRGGRELAARLLAAGELAVGLLVVLTAGAAVRLALGALYLVFAAMTLALGRRHAECGCFGDTGAPASAIGAALNLGFAAVCLVGAAAGAGGAERVLDLPAWQVPATVAALGGAALAAALTYTELPRAWQAWSGG
jgi:hypothetical protein